MSILIDAFLSNWNVDQFHIGGNSLGGLIAWLYASYHDEKVNKLLLLDPSGFPFDNTPMVIKLAKTPVLNLFCSLCNTKRFCYRKEFKEVYYDHSLIEQATIDRYYDLTLLIKTVRCLYRSCLYRTRRL